MKTAATHLYGVSTRCPDDIRSMADQARTAHDVTDDEGRVDVDLLLCQLGGRKISVNDRATLVVTKPGEFLVFERSWRTDRQRRFDIAQAIGRYHLLYLHPTPGRELVTISQDYGDGRDEVEANVFASTLLTPAAPFAAMWSAAADRQERVRATSVRFGVSPALAGHRAAILGLAGAD